MGHIVIAAIGNRGTEVCNLKGREQHLTLSDGDRNHRQTIPRTLISLVVELGIGNQTSFLAWQIDAEFISKAHRDHIVAPGVHRVLHRAVFGDIGVDHVVESPAEEAVTRCAQSGHQRQRGCMTVTANVQTFEIEAMPAGVRCGGGDDTFGEESEPLRGLKRRARRIEAHDTAIEQGFPHILREQTMILGALTAYHQTGIVRG